MHDGGLLMLLPFLLRQSKTWRAATLRLFVIAQMEDNNVVMQDGLQKFLYQLRISAQVNVIEMVRCFSWQIEYVYTLLLFKTLKKWMPLLNNFRVR